MGKMINCQGYSIYQAAEQPADDIVIVAHGSFKTEKAKYTTVPIHMSLYFYTFRGSYGTGGQLTDLMNNPDVESGVTTGNTVKEMEEYPIQGLKTKEGTQIMGRREVTVVGGYGPKGDGTGSFSFANGRITSIAGPGSKVWDYGLTCNGIAGTQAVKICEDAAKTDPLWLHRDIFMINDGAPSMKLSQVFKILGKTHYNRIHFTACRVESKTGFAGTTGWDDVNKLV